MDGFIRSVAAEGNQVVATGSSSGRADAWLQEQDGSWQRVRIDSEDRESLAWGIAIEEQRIVVAPQTDERASVWLSEDAGERWSFQPLHDGLSGATDVVIDGSSVLVSGWLDDRGGLLWWSEDGEDWETEGIAGRSGYRLQSVRRTSHGPVSVGIGRARDGAFVFYDDAAAAWRSRTNAAMRSDAEGADPLLVFEGITEAEDRLVLVGFQLPTWAWDYDDPTSAVIVASP